MNFKEWLQHNEVFGGTFRKIMKSIGLDSTTVYDDLARLDEEMPSMFDYLDKIWTKMRDVHGPEMAFRYKPNFEECWVAIQYAVDIIRKTRADSGIGEVPYKQSWAAQSGRTTVNYDLTEAAYALNAWYDLLDSIIKHLDTEAGAPPAYVLPLHTALKWLDHAIDKLVTVWQHFQPTTKESWTAMQRIAHIMPPNIKQKQYKTKAPANVPWEKMFGWRTRYSTKPSAPFAPSSFNFKKTR